MTPRAAVITLVAAVAANGTIGADGGLPWHLPADLKRFKAITMGHPMIMGRRTFESIGRVLPGRRTIVVTSDPAYAVPGALVAHSVDEALALAIGPSSGSESPGDGSPVPVMVVGGGDVYRQMMARADRLEITHVDIDVEGDTVFPHIDPALWRESSSEHGSSDRGLSDRRYGYRFVTYERRGPIRDLALLLSSLRPELHEGEFVFCSVPVGPLPGGVHPVVTVQEAEGTTVVVPVNEADAAQLAGTFRCAWITLGVSSDLEAVGLTAAVSGALTTDGIACNVVAGYHHDHLFVPVGDAGAALSALEALAHTRT